MDSVGEETAQFKTVVLVKDTRDASKTTFSSVTADLNMFDAGVRIKPDGFMDLLRPLQSSTGLDEGPLFAPKRKSTAYHWPASRPANKAGAECDDTMKARLLKLGVNEESIDFERSVVEYFFRFTVHTTALLTRQNPRKRTIVFELKKHLRFLWSLWIRGKVSKHVVIRETKRHFQHCAAETKSTNLDALFTRWHFNSWHSRSRCRDRAVHTGGDNLGDMFKLNSL
eukprot:CAMPEP_0198730738 /NCGR_PEP_ID=MMETSP1475-20131203/25958_1 /TAXON_ID= ORGANISM="Unidentified sp., Strain CCMP1999" /NCGR_SAMPLE_ID=MMETSP1475 /ASSEMBLY_ACC=CAM_ASM_001111 /LENGTH=225 /DNA_ID=CAMNT_0044493593 /DNA_START=435 /DNA_END=1112 /DNA_ORIENTATION=+